MMANILEPIKTLKI